MTDTPHAPTPRRKAAAPMTWPAFVVALLVAAGAAGWYALRAPSLALDAEIGPALWRIFNHSLVPTVVIALAVWCLLYFGFVRWKNGERGPLHFNTLLGVVFATMMLAPLARQQVDLYKAGDIRGLRADMAKAGQARKAEEVQAKAALDATMAKAEGDLSLEPAGLATAAARKQAKARVEAARQASKDYHIDYADRMAKSRATFTKVVAGRKVSAEIARESLAAYDGIIENQRLRAERDFDNQQTLFDEVAAGITALDHGLVEVQGDSLWFSSRPDAAAYDEHRRHAAVYRNRLARMVGASDLEIVGR